MAERAPLASWTVRPDEDGLPLVRFVQGRVPAETPERVRAAVESRVRVSWSTAVAPGDPVRSGGAVWLDPEPLVEVPDDEPLPLLAEGPGWIAVDKPAGVPVHPSRSVRINSLIERLRRTLDEPGLRLAHRLDRETSGVLLVARDRATAARFGRAFEGGAVGKEYAAVVRGVPSAAAGVVDLPVGRAHGSAVKVRQAAGAGRTALTRWWVEHRGTRSARLGLAPETGRRHQIRVHLEALGHPILGDVLYGRPDADYLDLVAGIRDARRDEGGPRRMLLHCRRLRIDGRGLDLDVASPLPGDMRPDPQT